jgi:hypothetical protein
MSLETTHHDIKVEYSVDDDLWVCWSMELKAKTLKALKLKMDKVLNVERRIDNLAIFVMGDGWGNNYKITRGVATLFDRGGSSKTMRSVWVNLIKGNQTERSKKDIESVWLDTPENRARCQAIIDQNEVVKAEQAKLRELDKAARAFTLTPLQVAGLSDKAVVEGEA